MPADGRAEESPQQGIQSIEVGPQVLRAPRPAAARWRSLHRMIYGVAAFGAPVFGPDRCLVLAIGLAMPARLMVEGNGARPTGWPTRSAVPPGRSRPNWDTARRNAPAPTRPQRWRR